MPNAPPAKPFIKLPFDKDAINERPKIDSQKYSTGPKANATLDRGGARSNNATAPTMPPNTEEKHASATARSPSPRLAIG